MKSLVESVSESLRPLHPADRAYKQINDICNKLVKKDSDCWDPRGWIQEMIMDWGHQYTDEFEIEQKIKMIKYDVAEMDDNTIDEFKALLKHKSEFDNLLLAFKEWNHPIAKYFVALLNEVKNKFK